MRRDDAGILRAPAESNAMPTSNRAVATLVCPRCYGELAAVKPSALLCERCEKRYPCNDGIADFSEGTYYDEFTGPEGLTPANRAGLEHEIAGAIARVRDFYAPLVEEDDLGRTRPLRVLDSGCGNGLSVDFLNDRGIEAWGNDISRLRRWQWRERDHRERLVVADTRRLPFPTRYFDYVISSGVIEHIGVAEFGEPRYRVFPLADRDAARIEFLRELLRVTAPNGTVFLDFPNGAFPIDFWHGDCPGGARFHGLTEGFLPTIGDVRYYLASLHNGYTVKAVNPYRRLQMRQVGAHWFGKLLKAPMSLLLRSMKFFLLRPLAGSFLNPYLVLAIRRDQ